MFLLLYYFSIYSYYHALLPNELETSVRQAKGTFKMRDFQSEWRGTGGGGGSLGEKGARGVWEAEKEGVGSGIPKVMGSRRNRGEYLCNTVQYFAIEKSQRGGRQQK